MYNQIIENTWKKWWFTCKTQWTQPSQEQRMTRSHTIWRNKLKPSQSDHKGTCGTYYSKSMVWCFCVSFLFLKSKQNKNKISFATSNATSLEKNSFWNSYSSSDINEKSGQNEWKIITRIEPMPWKSRIMNEIIIRLTAKSPKKTWKQ